jgi:hypothetical protein
MALSVTASSSFTDTAGTLSLTRKWRASTPGFSSRPSAGVRRAIPTPFPSLPGLACPTTTSAVHPPGDLISADVEPVQVRDCGLPGASMARHHLSAGSGICCRRAGRPSMARRVIRAGQRVAPRTAAAGRSSLEDRAVEGRLPDGRDGRTLVVSRPFAILCDHHSRPHRGEQQRRGGEQRASAYPMRASVSPLVCNGYATSILDKTVSSTSIARSTSSRVIVSGGLNFTTFPSPAYRLVPNITPCSSARE